jgi:hypothetical protein
MNPTTNTQIQNQIVFQALNHVEEMLNNTMREKLSNLEKTIKSKNYEVSQMPDEWRREWLLCLLGNLRKTDIFYKNFVSNPTSGYNYMVRKDLSYDKQIFECSSVMMSRLCSTYKKFLIYDGKLKKTWLDHVDQIYRNVESWNGESDCCGSSTEEDSDCMCDSQ